MTGTRQDHEQFAELAAGYALHALEHQEELRFLLHAAQCARCHELTAGYADTAAALADLAGPAEPDPQLGERIMAAARAEAAGRGPDLALGPAEPPPGPAWPRHYRRPGRAARAAVAAAAVVAAGAAVWAGLATAGRPAPGQLAACVQARACRQVVLTAAASRRPAARVVLRAGSAWLVPAGLPADNRARQVYVLWQITGARKPLAIGSFDIRRGQDGPIRIGALAAPYHATWAFAVSLEPGRSIPSRPSRQVALGQVPG